MLVQQQKIQFSPYSSLYDLIVPQDNLLRKINDLIDFSFIYDELLNKYCTNNGRTAESPVRMFKYLLLKTIYTVSDVDVVERSRFDMSFKYFLGMTPEEGVINSSSLTKFRKLRLKDTDLLDLLINKTVTIAIEKGIIRSRSIIVDATHTLSRSNPFSAIEVLQSVPNYYEKQFICLMINSKSVCPRRTTLMNWKRNWLTVRSWREQ
jgi:transposase